MADSKKTGSPKGGPLYLSAGFLRRPHGVRGEIVMDLHTDFPDRMKRGRSIYIGEDHRRMIFESVRVHGDGMLVKLKGVNTPEEAGRYRNQWVYIKTKDAPELPDGQYYKHELYGVKVIDDQGNALGELAEIIETGANDVYVVRDDSGREILLPAIPSVILDLEPDRGLMRVHILDGLIGE